MQTPRPSDQPSIRDELAATIHENFNACRGRNGVSPDALAQVVLDSPVIRRIAADAVRDAASGFTCDNDALTTYEIAIVRSNARHYLRAHADRIEKGEIS